VRLLSLPPSITAPYYNGPDDYLGRFGDEKFHEIFESSERRHAVVIAGEPEHIQELKFPDMTDAALDGRLGEIYQNHMKEFPRGAAWVALVTAAGVTVPECNPKKYIRTNLYAVIVAPPHEGKSAVNDFALAITGVKKPVLMDEYIGSAEGLVKKLGEGKGCGLQRLLLVDELSHLLTKSAIDRASFPFVLNTAYYKDAFNLVVAKQKSIQAEARLSVLGGIVTDNFQNSFGHATTFGLYDRFILAFWPTGFQYDFAPYEVEAVQDNPCEVTVEGEVWEVKKQWRRENPDLTGRIFENAIRVAVICASWSGCPKLTAKMLGPARAFAEYQARVQTVLQPNPGENPDARCAFSVMASLKNCRGGLVPRRQMYNSIHAERFGPGVFDRALRSLEANGELEQQGKRPKYLKMVGEGNE
jgi:hypothetical protein